MRTSFAAGFCFLIAAAASGQNLRSFVSVYGNDANNCSALFQCRSFFRAMNVTDPGGEVIATTSGGYVSFIVQKAITITAAPGAHVSITGEIGIAAGPTDRVVIRGLHVIQMDLTRSGIYALEYGSLFIEDCEVTGGVNGVWVDGSSSPTVLSNTVVRDFTSSGFLITGRATLLHCRAEGGRFSTGLLVRQGNVDSVVIAIHFVAVRNQIGAAALAAAAGRTVQMNLDHAMLSDNSQDGVEAIAINGGMTTVRVANSTVMNNGSWGFNQSGSAVFASMQNNLVAGNGIADTIGTISPIAAH